MLLPTSEQHARQARSCHRRMRRLPGCKGEEGGQANPLHYPRSVAHSTAANLVWQACSPSSSVAAYARRRAEGGKRCVASVRFSGHVHNSAQCCNGQTATPTCLSRKAAENFQHLSSGPQAQTRENSAFVIGGCCGNARLPPRIQCLNLQLTLAVDGPSPSPLRLRRSGCLRRGGPIQCNTQQR